MALMSLRNHSHVKASVVLTRAEHLCIHNYKRSLLNIILRPILIFRTGLEPASYCLFILRLSELMHTYSYTHIHVCI